MEVTDGLCTGAERLRKVIAAHSKRDVSRETSFFAVQVRGTCRIMDFYIVDEEYISYLQDYERKHRNGITRVPNVRYADRNKFSFGAVLAINDISYYVAVSSFKTKQEANILIYTFQMIEKKSKNRCGFLRE